MHRIVSGIRSLFSPPLGIGPRPPAISAFFEPLLDPEARRRRQRRTIAILKLGFDVLVGGAGAPRCRPCPWRPAGGRCGHLPSLLVGADAFGVATRRPRWAVAWRNVQFTHPGVGELHVW